MQQLRTSCILLSWGAFSMCTYILEPNFVSMAQMPESTQSEDGDDDKVYLFFSEAAVECDCYNKLVVSRVARVCKVNKELTAHLITHKKHFLGCSQSALSVKVFFHLSL